MRGRQGGCRGDESAAIRLCARRVDTRTSKPRPRLGTEEIQRKREWEQDASAGAAAMAKTNSAQFTAKMEKFLAPIGGLV
jgi:hypothetical protein